MIRAHSDGALLQTPSGYDEDEALRAAIEASLKDAANEGSNKKGMGRRHQSCDLLQLTDAEFAQTLQAGEGNPFQGANARETLLVDPFGVEEGYDMAEAEDPFADLVDTFGVDANNGDDQERREGAQGEGPFIPMPRDPFARTGYAENVGAKPVQPQVQAPQFAYTPNAIAKEQQRQQGQGQGQQPHE